MSALVIGIGNPDRGDDALGPMLVEHLARLAPEIDTATCAGDLTRLLELWQGRDRVVLVDMLVTNEQPPGTILSFDARRDALPYELACSSHSLDLSQCIELARALDQLPPMLEVAGVVGAQTAHGTAMSTEVKQAVEKLIGQLLASLRVETTTHA